MRRNIPIRDSASDYDRYAAGPLAVFDNALIRRLVELTTHCSSPPDTIVDVGTGTARLLLRISETPMFSNTRLIGLEFFPDMVEAARSNVATWGRNNITILHGDVHQMGFSESSIDCIITRSTIHHWARPQRALQEIFRILRPRRFALIHELRSDPGPEALREFNNMRSACGLGPTTLDEKYTSAELIALVSAAQISNNYVISCPQSGLGAIGVEIVIWK